MTKKVLLIMAAGSETVEIVAPADTLRSCGLEVTIASIDGEEAVKTAEGILIQPDVSLESVDKDAFDAIVLPGGITGSPNMCKSALVGEILRHHHGKGKLIGAICMAPTVLLQNEIGIGRRVTSYPKSRDVLAEKYEFVDDAAVVQDGNIVTSRGPGTVWHFTLKIAEILVGVAETRRVAEVNLLTEFLDKNVFK